MRLSNNQKAFFALLRAGLWEQEVRLLPFGRVDYEEVLNLAEDQSINGLITAGLEHVVDTKVPTNEALQFVGQTLQLVQQNQAMNYFIGILLDKMGSAGIYTVLVKGQGIAQCYERPLWRACGDVDLLLSVENYQKAIQYLTPLASKVEEEHVYDQHLAMTIETWTVELHGTLRSRLWKRNDHTVDEIQADVLDGGKVRTWMTGGTTVFLPRADEDVVFVFNHILQHFFKEGIGLRQICDWCRLLWTYRESIDRGLLKTRLKEMGVLSEWKAFAALAVDYLGMPSYALPFYSDARIWRRKAYRIIIFIIETGSFGHNRDYSFYDKYPYLIFKLISLWRHTIDAYSYCRIFPLDSIKLWMQMIYRGIGQVTKGV